MASISTKDRDPPAQLQALIFPVLEIDGENYLGWAIDARTHLTAEELNGAIGDPDRETQRAVEELPASIRSKALQALHRHLSYSL